MRRPRVNFRGLQELEHRVAELGQKRAHVGVLQGQGAETEHQGTNLTLAEIAAKNEFGDGPIPERSFIRRTFEAQRPVFEDTIAAVGKGVLNGKITSDQALGVLGLQAATEVKKTITEGEGVSPPLAAATIKKRRRRRSLNSASDLDRPLVDTGQLVNSITFAVRDRDTDAG